MHRTLLQRRGEELTELEWRNEQIATQFGKRNDGGGLVEEDKREEDGKRHDRKRNRNRMGSRGRRHSLRCSECGE